MHWPKAFVGLSRLSGPANQNWYVVPIAVPPSASPARHNVAPAIDVPGGAPNAHVAVAVFAVRFGSSASAATSAPPCGQVSSANVAAPTLLPLHPSAGALSPDGVLHAYT